MSEIRTNYHFLPYLRQGFAANIARDATEKRVKLNAKLKLKKNGDDIGEQDGPKVKTIELYGPGDIVGFDPSIVVRTNPLNNVGDFEKNFFPLIEFAEPDFPWRFTARAANESDGILPWITLIVLLAEDVADKEDIIEKEYEDGRQTEDNPAPWIKVFSKDNLPDLTQTWKWTHVQLTTGDDVEDSGIDEEVLLAKKTEPERLVSRLLCPRKLLAGSLYHAFVVPTFELGRVAGIGGEPGDINATQLSWNKEGGGEIKLPYYYKWEFRTGERGDFEHLVRLLEPRELTDLGTRKIDCSDPGSDLDRHDGFELGLEGALKTIGTKFTAWGKDSEDGKFEEFLVASKLNVPQVNLVSCSTEDPIVTPPIYGCWHRAKDNVSYEGDTWVDELNLDPRHRIASGFGAQVVKKQQEPLMASAWNQFGDIERANELLRQAQFGREVSRSIYKNFNSLSSYDFLRITNPLHSRIRIALNKDEICNPSTVHKYLEESRMPISVLDPAFRKVARKRGPIRRRQKHFKRRADILERLNVGDLGIVGKHPNPDGMVGIGDITNKVMDKKIKYKDTIIFVSSPEFIYKNTFVYKIKLRSKIKNIRLEAKEMPNWLSFRMVRRVGNQLEAVLKLKRGIGDITEGSYPIVLQASFNDINPNICYLSWQSFTLMVKKVKFISKEKVRGRERKVVVKRVFLCSDIIDDEKKIPHLRPFFCEKNLAGEDIRKLCRRDESLQEIKQTVSEAVDTLNTSQPIEEEKSAPLVFENIKSLVNDEIFPSKTILSRIKNRLHVHGIKQNVDPLDTIMAAPKFPQPMYEPLRDLLQDLILPGIEKIPQNTIGLLQPNHRFIESYMCGLNHEFAGELLWREYPTDQRGTYFRQFWDVSEVVPSDEIINRLESKASNDCSNLSEEEKINLLTKYEDKLTKSVEELDNIEKIAEVTKILFEKYLEEYLKDIKPIHGWNAAKLGDNAIKRGEVAAENQLVLTIRGDLLKKYPGTIIYAVRGIVDDHGNEKPLLREHLEEDFPVNLYDDAKKTDLKTKEIIIETEELDENGNKKYKWSDSLSVNKHVRSDPIFGGSLLPDIKFLGFDITEDQALGKETSPSLGGWYFIIEERVSETRFGLDLTDNDSPANITEWDDLTWQHLGLQDGDYLSNQEPVTEYLIDEEERDLKLNDNSPSFAKITIQKPVRIVVHAKQMIPRSGR